MISGDLKMQKKQRHFWQVGTFTFLLLLLAVLVSVLGCEENKGLPPVDSSLASKDGNFTLYVSNQSFDIKRVDIQIKIDGIVVVSNYFEVGNQHNWKGFLLSLPKGTHTIEIHSDQEDTNLSETFDIKDKHWAVVDFWYASKSRSSPTKKKFTFTIQDRPIGFA
jgi:hypothetical protein